MTRFLHWLKEEAIKIFPIVLFFFIAFSLVDLTRIVTEKNYYGFAVLAVGALMMGKVVLISDHLPFIARYEKKPLIYNTVWKTLIYLVCSFFVLVIDHLLPVLIHGKSALEVTHSFFQDISHLKFWVGIAWLGVLLFNFVAYRELIGTIGVQKFKKLFFG